MRGHGPEPSGRDAPTLRPSAPSAQGPWTPTHPGVQRGCLEAEPLEGCVLFLFSSPHSPCGAVRDALCWVLAAPSQACCWGQRGPITMGHSHEAP